MIIFSHNFYLDIYSFFVFYIIFFGVNSIFIMGYHIYCMYDSMVGALSGSSRGRYSELAAW